MNIATRFLKNILLTAFFLSAVVSVQAQSTREFAVMLRADISKTPDITISWEKDEKAIGYEVFRRGITGSWALKATLDGKDTSFTDTTTLKGIAYEYQVLKMAEEGAELYVASGYIYAGAEVYPVLEKRKALLVIDETFKNSLAGEIAQFETDLKNEGWSVVKSYVPRTEEFDPSEVKAVKKIIADEYAKDKTLLKSVVLIGRVAVPYSGDIFPDGHQPDHRGAWPCDGYYGDMTENLWTDNTVNVTAASRDITDNIPGDGKFDQDNFPSPLELAVGRIDLFNMTDFKKTELELLKAYFQRNHDFRTAALKIPQRGVVDDNFGAFINRYKDQAGYDSRYIESFASTAWRSWSPLVGAENIITGDYLGTLDTAGYLWAYGCGSGGYSGAGGIGSTPQFADSSVNTIFSSLFGSYFGDWDVQNNFLRAPLCASPGALTSVWGGRPHWFFHRMGLGETIGQAELITQNNPDQDDGRSYLSTSLFQSDVPDGAWYSNNAQGTHIALMGDPTLVMQPVERGIIELTATAATDTNRAMLIWTATLDTNISGYFVYRSDNAGGQFARLNSNVIQALSYLDTTAPGGENFYKVVAVKLQNSPSGSYFTPLKEFVLPAVTIISSLADEQNSFKNIAIQPNPARDFAEISFKSSGFEKTQISILDVTGREVLKLYSGIAEPGENSFAWNLSDAEGKRVPTGVYFVRIAGGKNVTTQKIVVMP
jgi:hypothetical protein